MWGKQAGSSKTEPVHNMNAAYANNPSYANSHTMGMSVNAFAGAHSSLPMQRPTSLPAAGPWRVSTEGGSCKVAVHGHVHGHGNARCPRARPPCPFPMPRHAMPCSCNGMLPMAQAMLRHTMLCHVVPRALRTKPIAMPCHALPCPAMELHCNHSIPSSLLAAAVEVEEVTFKRPVNVGDLIKFKSQVLHTWVSPDQPDQARGTGDERRQMGMRGLLCIASWGCQHGLGSLCACCVVPLLPRTSQPICASAGLQGMAYVQVQASVTQPEKRQRWVAAYVLG